MTEVKLTTEGIRYIALFESLTRAVARDCYIDDENDRVIFVVKEGDMGLAIGKNGNNINRVKRLSSSQMTLTSSLLMRFNPFL
jgi:N utilization substance protein A